MTQLVHVPLGDRAYDIHIGRGLLDQAGALIGPISVSYTHLTLPTKA